MRGRPKRPPRTPPADAAPPRRLNWARLGRWTLGLGLFGLMGAAGFWGVLRLQDPTVLPVRVLKVVGQPVYRHVRTRDIEAAVGRVLRGNLFTLDVVAVRRAAQALPWVARVSVRRVWPDTLQLEVLEQRPVARWGKDSLVNAGGQVFTPAGRDELPPQLVRLAGPKGSAPEVVAEYRRMRPLFAALGLQIRRLQLDARRDWQVWFANGLRLRLGNQALAQRLARFVRVYPRLSPQPERRLVSMDFRYGNGFAARWEKVAPLEQENGTGPRSETGPGRDNGKGRGQA